MSRTRRFFEARMQFPHVDGLSVAWGKDFGAIYTADDCLIEVRDNSAGGYNLTVSEVVRSRIIDQGREDWHVFARYYAANDLALYGALRKFRTNGNTPRAFTTGALYLLPR